MIREPFNICDLSSFFAGFWLGLLIAVFLLAIFFTVAIFKLNWKKMTEEVGASGLLKRHWSLSCNWFLTCMTKRPFFSFWKAIARTGKNANGAANGTMTTEFCSNHRNSFYQVVLNAEVFCFSFILNNQYFFLLLNIIVIELTY